MTEAKKNYPFKSKRDVSNLFFSHSEMKDFFKGGWMDKTCVSFLKFEKESSPFVVFQSIHNNKQVSNDKKKIKKTLKEKSAKPLLNYPVSIRMANIHFTNKSIKNCCKIFSAKSGYSSFCNLYLTPPGDKNCLNAHQDNGDQVIVQVLGEKTWYLERAGKKKKILLKAGDQLLLEPGVFHEAKNLSDTTSVHLTFAIKNFNLETLIDYHYSWIKTQLREGKLPLEVLEVKNSGRELKKIMSHTGKNEAAFLKYIKNLKNEFNSLLETHGFPYPTDKS